MTIHDVIHHANTIAEPTEILHTLPAIVLFTTLAWVAIIMAAKRIINIATGERSKQPNKQHIVKTITIISAIAGCASTAAILLINLHTLTQYEKNVNQWKTEIAYPYIKTLEPTDLELISIEVNPLTGKKQPDEIIQYRNAELIIDELDTTDYTLIYDVPAGQQPFVRFYELDTDLGHDLDAGMYGLDVHLNKK